MREECRECFPRHRELAVPTCITVAGKTFPTFPAHAQSTILHIWLETNSPPPVKPEYISRDMNVVPNRKTIMTNGDSIWNYGTHNRLTYRLISQMRALLAAWREPDGAATDCPRCYTFLNMKLNIFHPCTIYPVVLFWNISIMLISIS